MGRVVPQRDRQNDKERATYLTLPAFPSHLLPNSTPSAAALACSSPPPTTLRPRQHVRGAHAFYPMTKKHPYVCVCVCLCVYICTSDARYRPARAGSLLLRANARGSASSSPRAPVWHGSGRACHWASCGPVACSRPSYLYQVRKASH
jgi:hypothetical protein